MQVLDWPEVNPDLNFIEHLWDILGENVRKCITENPHDLREVLLDEWEKLFQENIATLIRSMPARIQAGKRLEVVILAIKCRNFFQNNKYAKY